MTLQNQNIERLFAIATVLYFTNYKLFQSAISCFFIVMACVGSRTFGQENFLPHIKCVGKIM